MTHALCSDDGDRLLGAPVTPLHTLGTLKTLMEKQCKLKPNCRVALCTNGGWENILSWTFWEQMPPSHPRWFTMIFYQTTRWHCPLSNWLPISHHSNPGVFSAGTGTQSPVPLWISQMYWSCQRLHCLIKVQSQRQCCREVGCCSLREENEEPVTSEFITPLLLMVL